MSRRQQRRTIVIALNRPGLVELSVREVAPRCRLVRRYRVHGHRGVNRLRLRRLTPGTYVVVARSVREGRIVGRKRLVVADRKRNRELRATREADSCDPGTSVGNVSTAGEPPAGASHETPSSNGRERSAHHGGVLGAKFGKVGKVGKALLSNADGVPLWVYGLLALAVGLLGAAAALPKGEPRGLSTSLLIGSVGAAILLGLTIVFALG
jgi:hypothetical protein